MPRWNEINEWLLQKGDVTATMREDAGLQRIAIEISFVSVFEPRYARVWTAPAANLNNLGDISNDQVIEMSVRLGLDSRELLGAGAEPEIAAVRQAMGEALHVDPDEELSNYDWEYEESADLSEEQLNEELERQREIGERAREILQGE